MKQFIIAVVAVVVLTAGLLLAPSTKAEEQSNSTIVLKKSNTIVLNEVVDDLSVAKVTAQAYALDASLPKGEPIYLVLSTPGGSITAGLEMYANLNALGRKINTITIFAASMGFQTVQNLGDRLILPQGELFSHHAACNGGCFGGEFGGKEPSQLTNRYTYWVEKVKALDEITVKRTNGKQTLESYQNAYENELWVSGQAAVDAGYADRVVSPKCDKSLSGTKNVDISYFGATIVLTMSECPLITGPLDYYVLVVTTHGTMIKLEDFKKLGGQFGNSCVSNNITQLCPKDITLTPEKIESLVKTALDSVKINKNDLKNVGYTLQMAQKKYTTEDVLKFLETLNFKAKNFEYFHIDQKIELECEKRKPQANKRN